MSTYAVTVFADVRAQTLRAISMSLDEMARHAREATAPAKDRLPLWKLATFGHGRTAQGSLRHDRNLIACTGIEADYDGEVVGFDEAVETAEKLGLRALVYTSPSHAPHRPRWRIMCPASHSTAPDKRAVLMGRLNGAYGGIFSRESWTLSQAFYFGSIAGNPTHRVEVVEGQPIDRLDELDEIWLGPPAAAGGQVGNAGAEAREDAELVRRIVTGEGFHAELCALSARYIGRGVGVDTVADLLRGLMLSHAEPARDARWHNRYQSIGSIVKSAQAKYGGGVEGRRAIARITHRMARRRRPAAEIRDAVLHEAEQRGFTPEAAVAIAAAILRKKVEGRRHA
jgi:hypothetical protein